MSLVDTTMWSLGFTASTEPNFQLPSTIPVWIVCCSKADFVKWTLNYKNFGILCYDFEEMSSKQTLESIQSVLSCAPISNPSACLFVSFSSSANLCSSLCNFFTKVHHSLTDFENKQVVIRVQRNLIMNVSRCVSFLSSRFQFSYFVDAMPTAENFDKSPIVGISFS